ncbi:MAG: transferase [Bacteroidales bacterium]|nr:transferase [Bacteroidales bacterium]
MNIETFDLIIRQLTNFWPICDSEKESIYSELDACLEQFFRIATVSSNKYFKNIEGTPKFSPYHSDQYAMLLYIIARNLFHSNQQLSEKLYYLNKVLHSIDVYPAVKLPSYFLLFHPVGAVLGRAEFNNYLTISQNCVVGNNKGLYPVIGSYVSLMAHSMVLGNSEIGNNCIISAGSIVKDQNVPANSIVFGISPNLIIKPNKLRNQYRINE